MAEEHKSGGHRRKNSLMDVPVDEQPDNVSGYKAAAKVGIDELMNKDSDDLALKKYKESLLGGNSGVSKNKFPNDDRHIIADEFTVLFSDHPSISFNPNDPNKKPFVIKEGSTYRIKIRFYCQHQLVSGLKYMNFVYKHGVRVDKAEEVLGSFAPQLIPFESTMEEETAPDGWLARGSYTAKTRLVDDDLVIHSELEYAFEIASDW